jgi:hypothetical protein
MLKEILKEKRPHLSDSSVNTYASVLRNVYKRAFNSDAKEEDMNIDRFNKEEEKVLESVKSYAPSKRKSILAALVVISGGNAKYRKPMLEDIAEYREEIGLQKKSQKQKENWVSTEELQQMYAKWNAIATPLLKRKDALTSQELQRVQNFVMLALYTLIPPRRSADYFNFKIRNVNESEDNFMKPTKVKKGNPEPTDASGERITTKQMFVFNKYKTAWKYHAQNSPVPPELENIIKAWIRVNPHEYLLVDTNGNKLDASKMHQRFNAIFGRKVSTTAFRHSFLTDKYKDTMEAMQEMNSDLQKMGSSSAQASTYVKLD